MNRNTSKASWLVPVVVLGWAVYLVLFPSEHLPNGKPPRLVDRIFRSLDWRGGTRLEYKMNHDDAVQKGLDTMAARQKALKQAQLVFLFRLRNFDLTENDVRGLGDDTIIAEVPGSEAESKDVEQTIHRTGVVTFREVLSDPVPEESVPEALRQGLFHQTNGTVSEYYQLGPRFIGAEDINYEQTRAEREEDTGGWVVTLQWQSPSRAKAVAELGQRYRKEIAICVDQDIQTIATVVAKELDQAVVTGFASQKEAYDLARVLAGGYLPVSFDLEGRELIGPRFSAALEERALRVTGFAVAFILILLFLRCLDLMPLLSISVASIALCALSFFCLILSGTAALSAATLCAFITLATMSADNLILVFEQFRAELRERKELRRAGFAADPLIKAYKKERPIILLANVSTALIIGSLYFADGPIQDLVTATCLGLLLTWITTVWYPRRLYGSLRLLNFLDAFNLGTKSLLDWKVNIFASGIQGLLLVVYLAALAGSMTCISRQGFQVGLDLRGGTEILVSSDLRLDIEMVRGAADTYFGRRCAAVRLGDTEGEATDYRYAIRVPGGGILDVRQLVATGADSGFIGPSNPLSPEKYISYLKAVTRVDAIRTENIQTIGGTELALNRMKLVLCVGTALVVLAILIGTCYGGAAALYSIGAMITDGIIALGAVSLFQVPLTVPVIAAILTVVGFSLYDSMLLCGHLDRAWKDGARGASLVRTLAPLSVRLLLISTATGGATVGLWIFGLGIIRDFGIVLTTGVVFGLMSSITIVAFGVKRSLNLRPAPELIQPENKRAREAGV